MPNFMQNAIVHYIASPRKALGDANAPYVIETQKALAGGSPPHVIENACIIAVLLNVPTSAPRSMQRYAVYASLRGTLPPSRRIAHPCLLRIKADLWIVACLLIKSF